MIHANPGYHNGDDSPDNQLVQKEMRDQYENHPKGFQSIAKILQVWIKLQIALINKKWSFDQIHLSNPHII